MTVENEVAALTTSVDALTSAVNVRRSSLDASVTSASQSADSAEDEKDLTSALKTETTTIKDAAVTASTSAATAAASAYQSLTSISTSKGVQAEDIFIYDTRKDSDGGAWRNRTQGTSWYKEDLNTTDRGATRKFPAVAVLVATSDQLIIYDGDDPSLPMWMEFDQDQSSQPHRMLRNNGSEMFVSALNGEVCVGSQGGYGLHVFSFIKDSYKTYRINGSGSYAFAGPYLSTRNDVEQRAEDPHNLEGILNSTINAVDVTVLPDAPIDPESGLPTVTIGIASNNGASIIKDDGSVVDISGFAQHPEVFKFTKDNRILINRNYRSELGIHEIPTEDSVVGDQQKAFYPITNVSETGVAKIRTGNITGLADTGEDIAIGAGAGLCLLHETETSTTSMTTHITNKYNTGWMVGDMELATLMDSLVETMSGGNILNDGSFTNGVSEWATAGETGTITHDNGRLRYERSGTGTWGGAYFQFDTEVGETYSVTLTMEADSSNAETVYFRASASDTAGAPNIHNTTFWSAGAGAGHTSTTTQTFVATHDYGFIHVMANASDVFHLDNVVVERVAADRSAAKHNLSITGNITKDLVATGSDLVGYKFETDSNKMLAVNVSDIGAPTHDYCWMWWQKGTDCLFGTAQVSAYQTGVAYNPTTGGYFFSYGGSVGSKRLKINTVDPSNLASVSYTLSVDDLDEQSDTTLFNHFCVVKKGAEICFYLNGELNHVYTATADGVNALEERQGDKFGLFQSGHSGARMALFRMSKTAPTPEQIKKCYRDEKPLFFVDAQCVLTGPDNVTCLDFDDDTKLLHVATAGTGSGSYTNAFNGIAKVSTVNQDTHHTNTAISASNGLVVEE